jgi:hypothetical protein
MFEMIFASSINGVIGNWIRVNGKLIFWQNQLPSKNKTAQIKILKNSLKNIKKNIVTFKKLK